MSVAVATVPLMKRDGARTLRLQWALKERNCPVSGRNLERWSQKGLGPSVAATFEEQVNHWAAVSLVSGTGFDYDLVARRIAARGFACKRLRRAIMTVLGISEQSVPTPVPDLSIEASGDQGFREVEQIARQFAAEVADMPAMMAHILRALVANAERNVTRLAGEWSDGRDVFHSFLVNGLCLILGGKIYDAEPIAAVFNLDPTQLSDPELDELNTAIHLSIDEIDDAYRHAAVDDIVAMADLAVQAIPEVLNELGVAEIALLDSENAAAIVAPGLVYLVKQLAASLDHFPREILPSLRSSTLEVQLTTAARSGDQDGPRQVVVLPSVRAPGKVLARNAQK